MSKEEAMHSGRLSAIVIVGDSFTGKTTLAKNLTNFYRDCFYMPVSATNRPIRDGEVDGVDYHFLPEGKRFSEEEFFEMCTFPKSGGGVVQYGTLNSELERAYRENKIAVLVLEAEGARAIRDEKSHFFASDGERVEIDTTMVVLDIPLDTVKEHIAETLSQEAASDAISRIERGGVREKIDEFDLKNGAIVRNSFYRQDIFYDIIGALPSVAKEKIAQQYTQNLQLLRGHIGGEALTREELSRIHNLPPDDKRLEATGKYKHIYTPSSPDGASNYTAWLCSIPEGDELKSYIEEHIEYMRSLGIEDSLTLDGMEKSIVLDIEPLHTSEPTVVLGEQINGFSIDKKDLPKEFLGVIEENELVSNMKKENKEKRAKNEGTPHRQKLKV